MGFIEILSKLFGNKSQRDLKEIMPYIDKIKAIYPQIKELSNDDLRAKSEELQNRLSEVVSSERSRIAELKSTVETTEIDAREKIFCEIDKIEKEIVEKQEKELLEILPDAFAVMKDTARRFTENETVVVTANDFDRNLAAKFGFVEIIGNQAHYANQWEAGGNMLRWEMVHYDVQLIGGVVLHTGKISEMATGEGKTLVATLPVFLNALTHNGVHVVTVNDYLAKRDSEWMGPLYMFHGLSVDCIDKHRPNSEERRQAYAADITFGTNNEFGFDYLRDNMASNPQDLVQRKHNYAIVDEVDSVLIDDARTPLIISGPIPKGEDQLFEEYQPRVEKLVKTQNIMATKLLAEARAKMASEDKAEKEAGALALFRSYKALPKNKALIKYLSEPGVKVQLQKTEEFYMQENNRNMPFVHNDKREEDYQREKKENDKRIAEGLEPKQIKLYGENALLFVVDEKNHSIELTEKGIELLTGSTDDPNFFILPDVGGEIADIEKDDTLSAEQRQQKKDDTYQNYSIKSERVHTVNQLLKAYTLFEKDIEYVLMDNQVKIVDEQTGRIMDGRRYSDGLHQAIEAKEHVKVEAATQTFATITLQNYFRMYEKLSGMTGTAETEAGELWDIYKLDVVVIPTNKPIARNDMNDRVYKTTREKYNAVIEEVVNLVNQGRPVLVGTTSVEISELLSRMLNMRKIKHNVLNAKLHQREADIVAEAGRPGTVTIATNMAGRGTDIKLTQEVKDAGGLAIIGTERHESRRVDRQLRGRAGRQGDPGSSVFFVSLEDNLMRLFGSERISGLMDRMGFEEGEVIEHKMISNSIERAQKKVEENHFGTRKRLLEYDDVMNSQRNVIYSKRKHALMGERIGVDITNMIYDTAENIVDSAYDVRDFDQLKFDLMTTFAMESPFDEEEFRGAKANVLIDKVADAALAAYKRKTDKLAEVAFPVIKQVQETRGDQYENILVPVTDGKRVFNVSAHLKTAYDNEAKEVVKAFQKTTLLFVIDDEWKEHLRQLDDLRQSVQNASYEQKDPLLIYKLESFNLFKNMVNSMNKKSIEILMRGQIPMREPEQVREAKQVRKQDFSKYKTRKDATENANPTQRVAQQDTREKQRPEPIRVEKKVGRNDPCPCGSGKKFKACHGKEQ